MPKTSKGRKIIAAMKKKYGSKKAEQVFYASKSKGTISDVDKAKHSAIAERARKY